MESALAIMKIVDKREIRNFFGKTILNISAQNRQIEIVISYFKHAKKLP